MNIETLDDYNQVNCCCPLAGVSQPEIEYQHIGGSASSCYAIEVTTGGVPRLYGVFRRIYTKSTYTRTARTSFKAWMSDALIQDCIIDYSGSQSGAWVRDEYEQAWDAATAREEAFAKMQSELDWEKFPTANYAESYRTDTPGYIFILQAGWTRYRWLVPDIYESKRLKVTWDVLEEPEGWNDSPPGAARSFYAKDLTWEWSGSVSPGQPAYSPWFEMPAPSTPGRRRVVNQRWQGVFSSKLGILTQVGGPAVELP